MNLIDVDSINVEDIDVASIGRNLVTVVINSIRSNADKKEGDTSSQKTTQTKQWANLPESYCHAFYRILGLPVIHADQNQFYNPGFLGQYDTSGDNEKRATIDGNQDPSLYLHELKREQICFDNSNNFNNIQTKIKYRTDMMRFPMDPNMLTKDSDALSPDNKQINDKFPDRKYFVKVAKILKPFKCVPSITNTIEPTSNNVCAPFVGEQKSYQKDLSKPYLELVARIRFASDITNKTITNNYKATTDIIIQQLIPQIDQTLLDSISSLSEIETYIFIQMFISFVSACNKIKNEADNNRKLGNEIYNILEKGVTVKDDTYTYDSIDNQMSEKKVQKVSREVVYAYIPIKQTVVDGFGLMNPINCLLNDTFLKVIQGDIDRINKEIQELEQKKASQMKLFNSINDSYFYLYGEVAGIGLLDVMALMMAFWLIPQEHLLGFFDGPSFQRLYWESSLRNSAVQARYNNSDNSSVTISQSLNSLDKMVYSLLNVASGILTGKAQ